MGMTPQHFYTIPASCAILPPLTQNLFVSCVQRRVVKGNGVDSGGCVVHVLAFIGESLGTRLLMSMESELCCGLMQCSCYTDHG